jgi:beta-glucosidase
MTLTEKANFVVLNKGHGIENYNRAIPALCIPELTLTDGPDGIAGQDTGATQFPAAISVGASFNPSLAESVGEAEGAEARTKGFDVLQGPNLNLARVPEGGRVYESYGEDPYLTSVLGVADIKGIQSQGVMALAKHFVAYTQETARARLNADVTARALAELYDQPFEAAVKDGHLAGIMCATGSLNGQPECSNPYTYKTLASWGFTGFVRSDERAARNTSEAFSAGLDLIKPATPQSIINRVKSGILPIADLNRAVRTVLAEMFAYGLIAHHRVAFPDAVAATRPHAATALLAAEEGAVLLKDQNEVLPLSGTVKSVAVIGSDATIPETSGEGSSAVIAPFVVTPLFALRSALSPRVRVSYVLGGPRSMNVGPLSTVGQVVGSSLPSQKNDRSVLEEGDVDLKMESAANVTDRILTASTPGTGKGWSHWEANVRAKRSGEYEISLKQIGDTWFYLNGRRILASPGLHAPTDATTLVKLRARRNYTLEARWFSVIRQSPPELGVAYVSPQIRAAVRVAQHAQVAIIFASDLSSEGADQDSMNLPGDQNALIEAVAEANPHTIVVLNTGNAVYMPWINHVQGVIEDWYPGEEDGRAIAAVLTGAFDPSGRLPLTFPASTTPRPVASAAQFPGVNGTVNFGTGDSGLDVGYRWYQTHNIRPLFPFGYGLSYTTFGLSDASVENHSGTISVSLLVTNTGSVSGADVIQVYVKDPAATGEPPEQLRAFARVALGPGSSRIVTMNFPVASLGVYSQGNSRTFSGTYGVNVGNSSGTQSIHFQVGVS